MGGHGQELRATGQVLLQSVIDSSTSASADRSITHNLAYKTIGLKERSMQNMLTSQQNSRTVCDYNL